MLVADTEAHQHGWRWLLVNLDTGERVEYVLDSSLERADNDCGYESLVCLA